MEKKIKFRRLISAFLAFIMVLSGISLGIPSDAHAASNLVRITNKDRGEVLGTLKIPVNQIRPNAYPDPNSKEGTAVGSRRFYTIHEGNDGKKYICIEASVGVSREYKIVGEFTKNSKIAPFIAYAENNNYSNDAIQAIVWTLLGQINLHSNYQERYESFLSAYNKNPNASVFKGAKVYEYHPAKNSILQRMIGWDFEKETESKLSLKKESTNPDYVKDNPNYSLAGAEYGIYTSELDATKDSNRVGTFTSDSNGDTNTLELEEGTYYVREQKAPKGYILDREGGENSNGIYKVELSGEGQTFTVKDKPKTDPLSLMLKKTDTKGEGLNDAEFEVKYYEELVSDVTGLTPKYTWTLKTATAPNGVAGVLALNDLYKIGGDEIPKDENGRTAGYIGTYTIQETKAPNGYVLDDTLHIRQLKEEGGASVLTFNAPTQTNESQKMRFTLQKEDLVNKVAHLEGSLEKAIYDVIVVESVDKDLKAGDAVKTVETDKDGKVLVDELELGIYDIVEKTPSKGYRLNPVAVRVEGREDNSGNEYTENVVQTKTNAKALLDLLNEKIEDLNTLNRINANGEKYRTFDKVNERQVNLEKKDNPTVYTNELAEYGRISLTKHADGEKGEEESIQSGKRRPEANITFDVFNSKNEKVDSFTTDSFGRATSKYLEKGRYRVHQVTKAPGLINVEDFYVDIEGDFKEYQYNLENHQNLKCLQIVKIDEETGKEILQKGVTFKLLDENKEEIHQDIHYPETQTLTEFVTNEKGMVQLPNKVKTGTYYIREIKAPKGYFLDLNGEDIKIEIKDDNTKVIIQQVKNIPQKGELILEKKANILKGTTEENGLTNLVFEEGYLADTKWHLIANEDIMSFDGQTKLHTKGDVVREIVTNGKDKIVTSDIALGKYILKEVEVNSKYVLDQKEYEIEFTPQESQVKVDSKTERKFNERKEVEFEVVKEFEDSKHFTFNPKAKFGLFLKEDYTENGVTIKKDTLIQKMTVNVNDIKENEESVSRVVKGSFKNITIDGNFYVKELNVDDNYILDERNHDLSFDFANTQSKENNKVSTKIENKLKKVGLSILKVEMGTIGEDQIPVAGSKYRLVAVDEAKGETTVGEYVTDQDGRFEIKDLARGKYYLVEIESPKGYLLNSKNYKFDLTDKDHEEVVETTTENERIPEIETTAKDNKTGEKEINPSKKIEIVDIVKYKGLIIGKEYELVGHLMDKETNKEVLDKDGKMIKSSLRFTPEERDGEVSLVFEVDASLLRGKEIVVFETLYREGRQVAIHHDIEDEGQTVKITDPKGKTYAKWEDDSKGVYEGKVHKLIDTFKYEDLIPGREYKLVAYVVRKANGKAITERKEVTFTPESKNGSIDVEFEIDTSKLGGSELVVFEELYDMEGNLLIDHKDINDKNQTVKINKKPVENPKTGDFGIRVYASMLTLATMIFLVLENKGEVKSI